MPCFHVFARNALLATLVAFLSIEVVECVPRRSRGNADRELRTRRSDCEKDACAGLDSEARLMCTYKCISPECNKEIYGDDEIEEGEVDSDRARQFAGCFRRVFKKEQEELLRIQREERLAKRAEIS